MHLVGIPPLATRPQQRAAFMFGFRIAADGEFRYFEGAHLRTVGRKTILRKTDWRPISDNYSARRTRIVIIIFNDGTGRVFSPRSREILCIIEAEPVMFIRIRREEQPPPVVKVKDRRIGKSAVY